MKKEVLFLGLFLLLFSSGELFAEGPELLPGKSPAPIPYPGDYVLSVGVLNGGGSFVGADLEVYVSDRISVQAGVGFLSFGGGVNYHFKSHVRSSFVNLSLWHMGIGDYYFQSAIGPSFVYRGKRYLQAQIGVGLVFDKGPYQPVNYNLPVMPFASIGIYLPGKKHW